MAEPKKPFLKIVKDAILASEASTSPGEPNKADSFGLGSPRTLDLSDLSASSQQDIALEIPLPSTPSRRVVPPAEPSRELARLRAHVAALADSLPEASWMARTGLAFAKGALEIKPSKGTEAVAAWLEDNDQKIKNAKKLKQTNYQNIDDLKEAILTAAQKFDEVAGHFPTVLGALYAEVHKASLPVAQPEKELEKEVKKQSRNQPELLIYSLLGQAEARTDYPVFFVQRPSPYETLASIAVTRAGFWQYLTYFWKYFSPSGTTTK